MAEGVSDRGRAVLRRISDREDAVVRRTNDLREAGLVLLLGRTLQSLECLRRLWTDVAVDAGVGALIDIVPWGGTMYDVATGVAKVRRERSDWTAVLLALNDTD